MKIISMLKLKKWSLEGAKLMAVFSIDLPGRVKNFELPRTKPLMPLFETIVNSIYAIEERQQNDDKVNGYINIEIIREPQMRVQTEGIDSSINDITGFVVTDNGIGFDENNMKSFLQSDSTYRAEKGGKGVGRFAWLKAFKEADIESSFIDAGEWVRRKFCFTLEQNEINDSLEDIDPLTDNKTIVALKECLAPYKKNLPKKGEVIATKIMQHCFIYLMSAKCPVIKWRTRIKRIILMKCLMNALKRSLKKSNLRLEMKTFHYCIHRLKMRHLGQANCIYMLMIEWFKK